MHECVKTYEAGVCDGSWTISRQLPISPFFSYIHALPLMAHHSRYSLTRFQSLHPAEKREDDSSPHLSPLA